MKRYIFFLRLYNDIDNITPAIYFFLKKDENNYADLILYDENYDYRNNENIIFLKNTFSNRFSYKWIGSFLGINSDNYFSTNKFKTQNYRKKIYLLNFVQVIKKRINKFIKNILNKYFSKTNLLKQNKIFSTHLIINIKLGLNNTTEIADKIIKNILNKNNFPRLVVFDTNRTTQIKGIIEVLKNNGIKRIISLPVSPLINYNTLRQYKFIDLKSKDFLKLNDYSGFDKMGFVDNYYVNSYNKTFKLLGINSTILNKTKSLGSIRYCSKWIQIKEQFIDKFNLNTSKIKCVFFLSHPLANINNKEVENIFHFFKNYPEYKLIVKHHTRDKIKDDAIKFPHLTFINSINSSALINWADVILFVSSSIAIEGFIKNKTMVCLSYIGGNKNLYDLFNAGYNVKCRDDLHEFLENYKKDKNCIKYNISGIQKLLNEIIIPDDNKVINNYLSFMEANEF